MNIVVYVNPLQEVHETWNAVITNMSEDDKAGIEFALQIKEKYGAQVTAVAHGDEYAELALREALAMGVDHAAWMADEEAGTDTVAKIVSILQRQTGDVLVTGRQDEVMSEVAQCLHLNPIYCATIKGELLPQQEPIYVVTTAASFPPRQMNIAGVYTAYEREIERIPSLTVVGLK